MDINAKYEQIFNQKVVKIPAKDDRQVKREKFNKIKLKVPK
tara:strand:- start:741 stop:863 length:123 start_codon:yes stop_codon:yes gene_type:complete